MNMPSGTQPAPGAFARAVSDEIRLTMARHRVSGAQVAVMIGRSQSYLSKRLRNEASFTANDCEDICRELDEDLLELLRRAVLASREPHGGSSSK